MGIKVLKNSLFALFLLVCGTAGAQVTLTATNATTGLNTNFNISSSTLNLPALAPCTFTAGHLAVFNDTNGTICDNPRAISLPGSAIQTGTTPWGALLPHLGGLRYAPCSILNPESPCPLDNGALVYQIPVSQIGSLFSTSGARNGCSNCFPTDGVKIYQPSKASMEAAGYLGTDYWADYIFGMGAPGTQFLQNCMNDFNSNWTDIFQQAWDLHYGCVRTAYMGTSTLAVRMNGLSHVVIGGTANVQEFYGQGQLFAHAQARVFVVSVNPSWNVGPSLIGWVAMCQDNGEGLIENQNSDAWQLSLLTPSCAFHAPAATTVNEWLIAANNPSGGTIATIQQGAAYAACTVLPCADGSRTVHGAGFYVQLVGNGTNPWPNLESGTTFSVRNYPPTLTSYFNDDFIAEVKSPTVVELHQLVTPQGLGPPSSFVTGDTLSHAAGPGIVYNTLQASTFVPHCTDPMGFEIECGAHPRTIVGAAWHDTSGVYLDNPCNRNVASWYGRRRRVATCALTASHTFTSQTNYVEATGGPEARTSIVYLGAQANQTQFGAAGDDVPWSITATASNDSLGAARPLINTAGTVYVPGDTVTLAGGTSTITAVLTVTNTTMVSATVAAGGSGCAGSGAKTLTGTTGTGTKATVNVTVAGNAVTAVNFITTGGSYMTNPTTLSAEPMTGDSCVGVQLSVVMGALAATATTRGAYAIAPSNPVSQASTSGSGAGATWNLTFDQDACNVALGVDTFTVADGATVQPVGAITGRGTITISGMLSGLTEGHHILSPIWKAPDGGICTAGAGTRVTAQLLQ